MKKIKLPAEIERIEEATEFVSEILDSTGCPEKIKMQMSIALDELMSNVARYAYAPETGEITLIVDVLEKPKRMVLTLTDSGKPYNPLEKEDPDITLSASERQIGGLGIFIVKKYMDDMTYEYKDGQNVVTITKILV